MLPSAEDLKCKLVDVSDGECTAPEGNCLYGSDKSIICIASNADSDTIRENYKFYILTTKNSANLGFYHGVTGGSTFRVTSNKAWLDVSDADAAKITSFTLSESVSDDDSTMNVKDNSGWDFDTDW